MGLNHATLSNKKIAIREVSFEDYPKVFSLQSRYNLEESSQKWLHLWVENPVLRDLKGWPIGWVLENESDQEIVGYLGNIPQVYEIGGKKLFAAASRAWVVDERFRSYSLLLLDKFLNQKNAQLCLATTSNPHSGPILEAYGGLRVPAGVWDEAAFWITHHHGFLASVLSRKRILLHRQLSYPLSTISKLADRIRSAALCEKCDEGDVTSCNEFDHRFDAFWSELRQTSTYLMGVRTREMLQWHFKDALKDGRVWIPAIISGDRILAYSIFLRKDSPALQLTRMMLIDFQSLGGELAFLEAMLQWALKKCFQERIHMLEAIGFRAEKREMIRKLAPYRRRLSSWLYYYKARDKDLTGCLARPERWDPSMFDGDASL